MRSFSALLVFLSFSFFCKHAFATNEYIDVEVGSHSICAIDTANQLECTTLYEAETYLPPKTDTRYTDVSVGRSHACAITVNGTVQCWGNDSFDKLNVPNSSSRFTQISAGDNHSCAVNEAQRLVCWGLNSNEQTTIPENENFGFVRAFAFSNGSCGIRESGETLCWSNDNRFSTDNVSEGYTDIVAGGGGSGPDSCGLTMNGDIDCWFNYPHSTTEIPNNGPYISIEATFGMICGLKENGDIHCGASDFQSSRLNEDISEDIAVFEALPPLKSFDMWEGNLNSSLCGLDFNNQIVCAGKRLPALSPPGADSQQFVVDNLDASYYSDSTIELMWSLFISPQRGEIPWVGFNIYRNNEFKAFTSNGGSYLDDSLQAGVDYQYAIKTVDLFGAESDFSNSINVNTSTRGLGTTGSNTGSELQDQSPELTYTRYGENSLELFWDRPNHSTAVNYRVYRNGELVAVAPGNSYFDPNATENKEWNYSVVFVRDNTTVFDVAFSTVPATGNQCF